MTREAQRSTKTIGVVTIGQTPRDDIVPELGAALGPGYEIEQVGGLDGLSAAEIESQGGRFSRGMMVTRLRNGEEVRVKKSLVMGRFKDCVEDIDGRVAMILVLCTGDLPLVRTQAPILYPGRILQSITQSLGVDRLGVLTPAAEQVRAQLRRWRGLAPRVFVTHVSPYGPLEAFEAAAEKLRPKKPDVVVMDCIGYTQTMQQSVRDSLDLPVLTALSSLALVASEMLGSADPKHTRP